MPKTASQNQTLRVVKQALRDENWSRAKALAWRGITDGLLPRRVGAAFADAGRPELLVHAMWKHRDQLFEDLGMVASFAHMIAGTALGDKYFPKLERWVSDEAIRPATRHPDYLLSYRDLDRRALFALFRLKYRTWNADAPGGPLREAARHADDFRMAPETTGFFYKHSRGTSTDLAAWTHEFKTAQMLHHLFADGQFLKRFGNDPDPAIRDIVRGFCRMAALEEYLSMEEAKRIYQTVDRSRGLLLCTFHSGFLKMSSFFFISTMPDPYWVTTYTGTKKKPPNIISAGGNERAAAFQIFKALTQGKAVLMAPDGPHYGASSAATIEVLGLKTTISQGFAAMAYEANCDTGWISAFRQGDMFVPEFIPGPRRQKGDIYSNFRDRWLSFYAERIQSSLSRGAESIVPFARWSAPYGKLWH